MSTNERLTTDMGAGLDETLQTEDIIGTAQNLPEISDFVAAIRNSDLERELRTPGLKTVFAPSNEAMAREQLPRDKAELATLLRRHIVPGRQTEADLRTTPELQTMNGDSVRIRYEAEGARFGGARVIRHDVPCTNGQIHVIDAIAT